MDSVNTSFKSEVGDDMYLRLSLFNTYLNKYQIGYPGKKSKVIVIQ